jgi:hypothetical protein
MSMSTHVVGFKPPDNKWKKMKAVYEACRAAKVDPPKEVAEFFEDGAPDDQGVEVCIENTSAVKEWSDDSRSGYEVDLKKLDPDVKIIRFYNSW